MRPPDTTDESDLVDQLVNEFNLTHEYIPCDLVPGQIEKLIDEILWYHDETTKTFLKKFFEHVS